MIATVPFAKKINVVMNTMPTIGSFSERHEQDLGYRKKYSTLWYYCRESFNSKRFKDMFFSHNEGDGQKIAQLVRDVERILGLKVLSRFGPTSCSRVMWIKPSKWWWGNDDGTASNDFCRLMRKSFFTMMLRSGRDYNMTHTREGVEEAFSKNTYGRSCMDSIRRFLDGHTNYIGSQIGWYYQFYNVADRVIRWEELLV